jgi:hypothetical protein
MITDAILMTAVVIGGGWGEPAGASSDWALSRAPVVEVVVTPPVSLSSVRHRVVLRITPKRRDKLSHSLRELRSVGWRVHGGAGAQVQVIEVASATQESFVYYDRNGWKQREVGVGCGEPLDQWSITWLYTGKHTRPKLKKVRVTASHTGNYPIRGSWYNVDNINNPSKQYLIQHLRGPNHRDAFKYFDNLESWSYSELMSAHSDHHSDERKFKRFAKSWAETRNKSQQLRSAVESKRQRQFRQTERYWVRDEPGILRKLSNAVFGTRKSHLRDYQYCRT